MSKTDFIKNQLTDKILEMLPKQYRGNSDSKQRKFLIQCISDLGYIEQKTQVPERDSGSSSESLSDQEYYDDPEEKRYLPLSSNTPSPYGFTRTFIQGPDSRLTEIQKRGISYEETELSKVGETIDLALNKLKRDINIASVKEYALKMYQDILEYYRKGNKYNLMSNTQSIKRGYIALVVWYSLINFQVNISREQLVKLFTKLTIADLFESEKYMKLIFKKLPELKHNLYGMESVLKDKIGNELINTIFKVIEQFGNSPKYTAAAVYFICSVSIHKGGVVPVKIKGITLELLEKYYKITQSTISKGVKEIIEFYSVHPEAKSVLFIT
jgi:hypothetical protein